MAGEPTYEDQGVIEEVMSKDLLNPLPSPETSRDILVCCSCSGWGSSARRFLRGWADEFSIVRLYQMELETNEEMDMGSQKACLSGVDTMWLLPSPDHY
jgi:hypothetical protein